MWKGDRGRVTESLLKRFVPDLDRQPVYLCGPNEMMEATRSLLLGLGVPNSRIKTENFGLKKEAGPTPEASNDEQQSDKSNGTPSVPEIAISIKTIDFGARWFEPLCRVRHQCSTRPRPRQSSCPMNAAPESAGNARRDL